MGCLLGKLSAWDVFNPCGALSVSAATVGGENDEDRFRVPAPPLHLRRGLILSAPTDPSGWPLWLSAVAGDALSGWLPRRATSFQKLEKVSIGFLRFLLDSTEMGFWIGVARLKLGCLWV